ncbi:MAG: saccharopine dehydrogenase NADP-binding domain-containing protein [Xanthobacteraceae bacterium]
MSALILGGYGNFGKRIAGLLTRKGVAVVIAGRDAAKAEAAAKTLPPHLAEHAAFDAKSDLARHLALLKPSVVINTCGPFQNSDYGIAETCIASAVPYIDLADGRDFVTGITTLDAAAKKQNVAVISGASTVPALTCAVIENLTPRLPEIYSLTIRYRARPESRARTCNHAGYLGLCGQETKTMRRI